jgi:NRAMP (natural resistance-associated macrophage protein)-like metal ion transporter
MPPIALRARQHQRGRLRGYGYFKGLGPGLITGAADDDPSGIGTYSQVGATLRFDLLWTAVISLPLAAAVVELSARFGLVTDRGLASIVRDRFAKSIVYPVLFIVVAANTFNVGADLGSMAAALRLLVPVPALAGVALFAVVIAVLEIRVPYDRYAKLLRWLVLSLAAYFGVLFSVHVPWGEVARNTLVPHLAADREHLAALIAIFGTTISPYLFFWQAAEEMEEQTGAPTATQIRRMRVDVVTGIAAGVAVMFAILTATAVTLGAEGHSIETADQAARALRPVAGDLASLLFTIGIVGTGLLAVPTLVGSSAYALAEAFHWREGLSRSLRQAPGFYAVIIGGMVIGAAMNVVGVNPIRALFLAAILNGLAAPPILILMAIASRSRALGSWKSGRISLTLVSLAALVMTVLPAWFLFV